MKYSLVAIAFAVMLAGCNSQEKVEEKEYQFPQVGWSIKVPSDYTVMDSAQIRALNQKGVSAIEKTYDTAVNFNDTKTLISVKKGETNMLNSTVTPFNPARDGSWEDANINVKAVVMETFQSQMPNMKIDTSSSDEKIDGVDFNRFHMLCTYPNGKQLHTYMYGALRNGFDFGINVTYMDEKEGKRLMDILEKSKFDKK